jgi:hypothetical protein
MATPHSSSAQSPLCSTHSPAPFCVFGRFFPGKVRCPGLRVTAFFGSNFSDMSCLLNTEGG